MNIDQALDQLKDYRKKLYFQWKHDIRYDQTRDKLTEEELLKQLMRKSLNPYIKWERSNEYQNLVYLYMQGMIHNDLLQSYQKVAEKSISGDEKSIKLLLDMSKVIKDYAKFASKEFEKNSEEIEEDDDLEV